MNKISDAIQHIISENPFLQFGLDENLLNLTQLSKFLTPIIAAKTKKPVTSSAILMQLSRSRPKSNNKNTLKLANEKLSKLQRDIELEKLTVHSNLSIVTYYNSPAIYQSIHKLHNLLKKDNEFFTCTEGAFQVTIIFQDGSYELVKKTLPPNKLHEHRDISCLISSFKKQNMEVHGFIYKILQQLYFQNINIIEVASTATELSIFLKNEDTRLAFDTIYNSFLAKR